MKKKNLSIIGVGMMGGSIGLSLKKLKLPYHVVGIGRNMARLSKALKSGICDQVTTDLVSGVKEAELVIICTPVEEILPHIKKIHSHLKPGAILTDVGSTKGELLKQIKAFYSTLKNPPIFIGGHPLAGSEKTGSGNASVDLYQGSTVVLCPLEAKAIKNYLIKLKIFWKGLGAKPIVLAPEIHDILVAQTSHLPHVLAGVLVRFIERLSKQDRNAFKLLAGSFRDLTRIADSDPIQWAQICSQNKNFILGAMISYRDMLTKIISQIENSKNSFSDWESFFSGAKKARKALLLKNPKLA